MSFVESSTTWVRQSFAWSNSWDSWRERLIGLAFVLIGALLAWLSAALLGVWLALPLWVVFAIALGVCSRQGWIKLFGPVLFYDMVRTSRRSRYAIIRILYGAFLFILLCWLMLILQLGNRMGAQMGPRETAVLAETFFGTFMIVQLILIVLLTPAYVAGAIAEEKDRKTLEFLLATDLHNREIVLSKFLSRLANLTLLLMTGLPILSILQLLGGVDPELMLAGFAGVGLTMLGVASLSILLSTLFKKPRDAISLTYLFLLAYGSVGIFGRIMSPHPFFSTPIWFGDDPPQLRAVIEVFDAGDPVTTVYDVIAAINGRRGIGGGRTTLAAELPNILTRYAWFHLVVTTICIVWSIARVRAIALVQTTAGKTAALRWWERFRPSVGNFPMMWKEFFIEGRTKFNWMALLATLVLIALTLGTGLWILGDFLAKEWNGVNAFRGRGNAGPFERLGETMNIWFRIAGTCVGCLTLVMLGVRAATSITNERERDTLDALITTPMSADGMLFSKVLGNLTSMRPAWIWFTCLMLLAVLTGGLHPLAVPFIISAWLVYALFITMIGLMYSMFCKSSIWSALFTVLTTLAVGGGHWLITGCCCAPVFSMMMIGVNRNGPPPEAVLKLAEYFVKFQAGLTPPFVFVWCSPPLIDTHHMMDRREFWELTGMSFLGLFLWTAGCAIMWFGVLAPKFRQMMRRHELEYS